MGATVAAGAYRESNSSKGYKMAKKDAWIRVSPKEVEKLVGKFARQGKLPSVIGMILRDEYGIPDVKKLTGKSITKVIESSNVKYELPEELRALIQKSLALRKHIETNIHDMPSKRSLAKTEANIRSKIKYYKRTHKLAQDWKYNPDKIKLLLH